MFDPRPLCCSSLTTTVGGTKDKKILLILNHPTMAQIKNLTYEETHVQIVDREEQVLRSKVIPLVKVLWKNHEREAST